MSTFLPKADEITRNWYVIDAAGKPLGRVASELQLFSEVSTSQSSHQM